MATRLFRPTLIALAIAWMAAAAPVARAKPPARDDAAAKAEAHRLLSVGDGHLRRGDRLRAHNRDKAAAAEYEQALAAYEKAHAAYPTFKIYFPIATAQERLGHYADALKSYDRVLAHGDEIDDKLRAQIELRMSGVREHVVEVVLDVSPEGAAVIVDGTQVGTAPLPTPLYLAPGDHKVAVKAPDHLPKEITVTVTAGQRVKQTIALAKRPLPVAEPLPSPALEPAPRPSKLPLILGASAAGAFVVAAGITGGLALDRHGTYTDVDQPVNDRNAARDSGKTLALTTDILAGAAVATGIFTAWYYFTVYRPESEAANGALVAASPEVMVTPYAAEQGAGIAAIGRF
ncbi:MAG TPA: PEGA domain-containing protein [Kofleriaceae bacterium]|nr:PEGA domain-containing protein [Kofleriaceae bacterium]